MTTTNIAPANSTQAATANAATADAMMANIALAQKAHIASRDSAVEAVGHTYLVWRASQYDLGREWLQQQIDEANKAIEAHNKAEKNLRKKVQDFLSSDQEAVASENEVTDAATEAKISEAEKAALVELGKLNHKQWMARRKLPIKARRGANPFTTIVKFVMGFVSHSDSSMTSRYATVLSWVEQHFAGSVVDSVKEIAEAIKAAGGFEAVCRHQGNVLHQGNEDRKVQSELNKSIKDFVKLAAKGAPVKGALDFKAKAVNDDFVVLIGRQNGDKLEVISDVQVKPSDLDSIIARVEDEAFLPADKSSQLVHRVLSLGHVVEHARPTAETVDGTKAGAKRYTERVLTLRPDAKGQAQLVVSARYGDASAVVYATPKTSSVDFGPISDAFVLSMDQYVELEKRLKDRYQRRFMRVETDAEPVIEQEQYLDCKLTWSTAYCEQVDPQDKAGQTFYWTEWSQDKRKPFDVENCQWQFEVTADKAQFETALSHFVVEEDGKLKHAFPDEAMTLAFGGSKMAIKATGFTDVELAVGGTVAEPVELRLRPQDVSELLANLVAQDADNFTIKGDDNGALAVFWGDELADYAVYIPTCKADLSLESRRVASMRNKIGPVIALAQKAA